MRIAVMIISLCLVMIIGVQSCTVGVGGELSGDEALSEGGAAGVGVAFLFLIGGAFALGVPVVSVIVFGLAALAGFSVGASTEFEDMTVWGSIALVLAVLSVFGMREKKKKAMEKSG